MQEIINHQWQQFVTDSEKAEEQLRVFVARYVLTTDKTAINNQEALNLIRSIPNVTTVTKEAEVSAGEGLIRGLYSIKFVLEPLENLNTYLIRVLKRELQRIDGLRVNSYKGVEELA